ncbi:hypothetical protein OX284_010705 [Flavobacterium sp. SUN046]|uniref:hypothetical protein n=1 Tax=Flavobacterium sp. SUN046 TaxID=3002440 RepID=UPI002DB8A548|nr:hypothetical protein [Flavobacterium sp. SUN046]MEC4049899.1 hypothetical protein [Flavobacterium sp. SUN046]
MISITDTTIIYILCPANFATGGPEALHQLGAQLLLNDYKVYMYYHDFNNKEHDTPVHKNYVNYNMPYVLEVQNAPENVIIFPETFCLLLWDKKYSKLQKVIWWLSVTNFIISYENAKKYFEKKSFYAIKKYFKDYPIPSMDRVKNTKCFHIAHSYFSIDYLKKNNVPVLCQVSDYMNDRFLSGDDFRIQKENLIIYNPIKNGPFLEKIKERTADLKWIALDRSLSPSEVLEYMKKAKVYIDFGFHPGKEKMPRESCLMDCCLIIGKDGSAQFKEDMPILDQYHFEKEDSNIDAIVAKVRDCLTNYEQNIENFSNYKQVLLKEKEVFAQAVSNLFKKEN